MWRDGGDKTSSSLWGAISLCLGYLQFEFDQPFFFFFLVCPGAFKHFHFQNFCEVKGCTSFRCTGQNLSDYKTISLPEMELNVILYCMLFFFKHFLSICKLKDKYSYDCSTFWNSVVNIHSSLHKKLV